MSEPQTHLFEVKMNINDILSNSKIIDKGQLEIKMPVWTPGSYLVREYARQVQNFEALDGKGQKLKWSKINKNTWRILTENADDVMLQYKVYAFELSVRTSFLDENHGYLNGASIFMYVPQLMHENSELTVKPHASFNTVSTALPEIGQNKFLVKDYDTLVDSPIEIGNHEVLEFTALGVPHKIAMFSTEPLKYDKAKLLEDYKKLVEAENSVVKENPLDHYLFIIHHQPGIGGGLEHLFSTTCQTSPQAYATESNYKGFFSLLAHEYFHLWNVKRIRPMALGPFDYDNENYTHMLWVAEGFTSFYEEAILTRAGIISPEEALRNHASTLNSVLNTPGNYVQSATEASWDAWIKYYRPDENSVNTGISYYSKGGALAFLLNALIIDKSNGNHHLDDVMQLLYQKYYKELGRGYTDEEFQSACEEVAGSSLNEFFVNNVSGTETPEIVKILDAVGIETTKKASDKPYLGILERGGTIARMYSTGSAYLSGLNVGDKIIKINGSTYQSLDQALKDKNVGDKSTFTVERNSIVKEFEVVLMNDSRINYELKPQEKMNAQTEKAYKLFMSIQ